MLSEDEACCRHVRVTSLSHCPSVSFSGFSVEKGEGTAVCPQGLGQRLSASVPPHAGVPPEF